MPREKHFDLNAVIGLRPSPENDGNRYPIELRSRLLHQDPIIRFSRRRIELLTEVQDRPGVVHIPPPPLSGRKRREQKRRIHRERGLKERKEIVPGLQPHVDAMIRDAPRPGILKGYREMLAKYLLQEADMPRDEQVHTARYIAYHLIGERFPQLSVEFRHAIVDELERQNFPNIPWPTRRGLARFLDPYYPDDGLVPYKKRQNKSAISGQSHRESQPEPSATHWNSEDFALLPSLRNVRQPIPAEDITRAMEAYRQQHDVTRPVRTVRRIDSDEPVTPAGLRNRIHNLRVDMRTKQKTDDVWAKALREEYRARGIRRTIRRDKHIASTARPEAAPDHEEPSGYTFSHPYALAAAIVNRSRRGMGMEVDTLAGSPVQKELYNLITHLPSIADTPYQQFIMNQFYRAALLGDTQTAGLLGDELITMVRKRSMGTWERLTTKQSVPQRELAAYWAQSVISGLYDGRQDSPMRQIRVLLQYMQDTGDGKSRDLARLAQELGVTEVRRGKRVPSGHLLRLLEHGVYRFYELPTFRGPDYWVRQHIRRVAETVAGDPTVAFMEIHRAVASVAERGSLRVKAQDLFRSTRYYDQIRNAIRYVHDERIDSLGRVRQSLAIDQISAFLTTPPEGTAGRWIHRARRTKSQSLRERYLRHALGAYLESSMHSRQIGDTFASDIIRIWQRSGYLGAEELGVHMPVRTDLSVLLARMNQHARPAVTVITSKTIPDRWPGVLPPTAGMPVLDEAPVTPVLEKSIKAHRKKLRKSQRRTEFEKRRHERRIERTQQRQGRYRMRMQERELQRQVSALYNALDAAHARILQEERDARTLKQIRAFMKKEQKREAGRKANVRVPPQTEDQIRRQHARDEEFARIARSRGEPPSTDAARMHRVPVESIVQTQAHQDDSPGVLPLIRSYIRDPEKSGSKLFDMFQTPADSGNGWGTRQQSNTSVAWKKRILPTGRLSVRNEFIPDPGLVRQVLDLTEERGYGPVFWPERIRDRAGVWFSNQFPYHIRINTDIRTDRDVPERIVYDQRVQFLYGHYGIRLEGHITVRERLVPESSEPEIESVTIGISHPKGFHGDRNVHWQQVTLNASGIRSTTGMPFGARKDPMDGFAGMCADMFGIDIRAKDRNALMQTVRDGIVRTITDPEIPSGQTAPVHFYRIQD